MGKSIAEMNAIELAQHFNIKVMPTHEEVERLSSGSLSLDKALGGGLARGRIQEFWGEPSNGKSLAGYIAIGKTLRGGGKAMLIDTERSWDPEWASFFFDINDPNFDLRQQERDTVGEVLLDYIDQLTLRNEYDLIVLDSKDGVIFRGELEGDNSDTHMGLRSRRLGLFIKKLNQLLGDCKTAFLFVSQVRAAIGNTYNPITTAGGYQMDHYCAIQVRLNAPAALTVTQGKKTIKVGFTLQGNTTKNKTAKKGQEFKLNVREFELEEGGSTWLYDRADEVINFGEELGLFLNASGDTYTGAGSINWHGINLGNRNAALMKLREDEALCEEIELEIRVTLGWAEYEKAPVPPQDRESLLLLPEA